MMRSKFGLTILGVIILAFVLAWVSAGFDSFQGWGSFFAVVTLGAGILWVGWKSLKAEKLPAWLGWLLIGAALLRLLTGVFWFVSLPQWGYGNEFENLGYVMEDAHTRDSAAWELSQSDHSLFTAFRDYRVADQYGGLLFLSAGIYRIFGGEVHQPLMIVVLTAAFSALSVLFTYAFASRLWDVKTAKISAWLLLLYPDAVLLGSSQMREAFVISLVAMAVFGLVYFWQDRHRSGLGWVLGALLLVVPLTSMYAIILIVFLGILGMALGNFKILRSWQFWVLLGLLGVVAFVGMWLLGSRIFPGLEASNPLEFLQEWLKYAAKWELYTAERSSGWIQKIFRLTPEWTHTWIILAYGVVQPFLPASLIATGILIWRGIAIWRALGWTLLLVFLLYALFRAVRQSSKQILPLGMTIGVWLIILIASYRGGGDQWDNPRYRTGFIALHAATAAWVLVKQKSDPDPWFKRVLFGAGFVFLWFIPWYVRRYIPAITWPVEDLFKTVTLGMISAVLYWIWDWARGSK